MLTVRHVEPTEDGAEREVYAIPVPQHIEADGWQAIDAFVTETLVTQEEEAARTRAEAETDAPTEEIQPS